MSGISVSYISSSSFSVSGADYTDDFNPGRRIKAFCGEDGYKYGWVLSSSYSPTTTTVVLTTDSDALTSNLLLAYFAQIDVEHDSRFYNKTEVDTISGSLSDEIVEAISNVTVTYYLDETLSDIGGYELLNSEPSELAESYDSVSISSGDGETPLDQYITVSGEPNTTGIIAGTWTLVLWADVSNTGGGPHYIRAKWYRREQGGAEHYLFTQEQPITSTAATRYFVETSTSGIDMSITDRLVVKMYAQTNSSPSRTIGYYVGGVNMVTRFNTPVYTGLITDHGGLTGLEDDDHAQYHTDARGDARYYTESEVDTISGSLSAEIDSDISTHSASADHDGRYYTESEVDDVVNNKFAYSSDNRMARYDGTDAIQGTGITIDDQDNVNDVNILTLTSSGIINIGSDNALRFPVNNTNVAIGPSAGNVLTTDADSNIAIGDSAMLFNEIGDSNVIVGREAGYGAPSNNYSRNTFIGYRSGFSVTTGSSNTSIGYQTGRYNQTGIRNVIMGEDAGYGVESNSYSNNTFLGYQSGYSTTTGTNNVFLGYKAGYNETSGNRLYIESSDSTTPLIYGEFDNDFLRMYGDLDVTGNLTVSGIGVGGDVTKWTTVTTTTTGTITLTTDDFGKTYVYTATIGNVEYDLPSISSDDLGAHFRFVKTTSGTLTINAADSDIIIDSSAGGSITCSSGTEIYANIGLQLVTETLWISTGGHGHWATT